MRRRRWREVLLAAGALLAAVGLAEAALRLLRPWESRCRFRWLASARYHHVNPPGRRMFSGWVGQVPIVVETNEDGFRTAHSRARFLERGLRIAVLGDSFVFGSGVNAKEAFPAVLEQRLHARAETGDVAVLNAGVISYSPFIERRVFEDVVSAYRPTLVLLFLDVTDIGDDFIYARKAGGDGGSFRLEGPSRLDCHGAVHQLLQPGLSWLGARLRALRGGSTATAPGDYYLDAVEFQGQPENRYFIYRHPLERTEPYFRETLRHLGHLAAGAQRGGARFVLVLVPRYHHWSTKECPHNWERGVYWDDEPFQYEYFRFFERAAAGVSFPILDLLPAFQATAEFPLVFPNDPHWNARGHDFVARQVESYLRGRRLIP